MGGVYESKNQKLFGDHFSGDNNDIVTILQRSVFSNQYAGKM